MEGGEESYKNKQSFLFVRFLLFTHTQAVKKKKMMMMMRRRRRRRRKPKLGIQALKRRRRRREYKL
jgi:hypothetical protein